MVSLIGFTRAIAALRGDHGQDVATQASIWSGAPSPGGLREGLLKTCNCLDFRQRFISNHEFWFVWLFLFLTFKCFWYLGMLDRVPASEPQRSS